MDNIIHKPQFAYAMGTLATLIWAGNFIIARAFHAHMTPMQMAYGRWFFCLVFLLPVAWIHGRSHWRYFCEKPWLFLTMGVLGIGLFNTLLYKAAHTSETQNLALISSTAPIWTFILAWVAREEELTKRKIAGACLAALGAFLVITRGSLEVLQSLTFNQGDVLTFIAAWIWALYCVLLRHKPQAMAAGAFVFVLVLIGVIVMTPFYMWDVAEEGLVEFDWGNIVVYLYLSLGASIIAFFAWNHATLTLGATRASLTYYLVPVFSALMAVAFLGEPVRWFHLLAFALVLSGIFTSSK